MRILPWLAPATLALALTPLSSSAAVLMSKQAVGRPAASQSMRFLVHLPLRNRAELEQLTLLQGTPGNPNYHHWITPLQFRATYGATDAQKAVVVNALHAAGISVDRVSSQFVTAHASVATITRTFGADIRTFKGQSGKLHVGAIGAIQLPAALRSVGAHVEGLTYHGEGEPMMRKQLIGKNVARAAGLNPFNRYGQLGPLWFDDVKQAYHQSDDRVADGTGVRVATVNEDDFSSADLTTYLEDEKIGNAKGDLHKAPTVYHALVPGAPPFDPNNGAAGEADLDTQQVAGGAPGATLTGWTTDAFDFPSDFLQVYDFINETNSEDIVSTSYGECELYFTAAYNGGIDETDILQAIHDEYLQGNSQGITFTVSSGDSAGRPCYDVRYFTNAGAGVQYSTVPSVDAPANDPNALSVGGGNLITSQDPSNPKDLNSTYVSENADANAEPVSDPYGLGNTIRNQWWGAGGGQSTLWTKPSWQTGVTPGTTRSMPDIGLFVGGCFSGDPGFVQPCAYDVSHEILELDGSLYLVIGTSVAAPESAAMIATLEDNAGSRQVPGSGRFGNISPFFYSLPSQYFHKGMGGYTGVSSFNPITYWEPSYGLGSLFQIRILSNSAQTPQTPSNP